MIVINEELKGVVDKLKDMIFFFMNIMLEKEFYLSVVKKKIDESNKIIENVFLYYIRY